MKILQKIVVFSLVLNIFSTTALASKSDDTIMKIGLFYGSNSVATTNLDNYTGDGSTDSGHYFGYFDEDREFVEIFDTDYAAVTVMKDTNIYLGTDGLYYDTALSSPKSVIGAYHLELDESYDNPSDAEYRALEIAQNAFVSYIDGVYKVRVASYRTTDNANSDVSAMCEKLGVSTLKVVGGTDDTYTVTNTKTDKILFEFSNDSKFGILPKSEITWNKGYRYYGGFEYYRQYGGDISVINVVSMDDYIKGVLPYEMNSSWHIEALKAQALTARSYAYNNINKHSKYGFDLCNGTDCQVYRGTSQANENSDRAVDETSGQYISYNGEIVTGFFHSSCGGATENSENVWGTEIPYLKGVIDPYEQTHEVLNGVWSQEITNAQIEKILQSKNYNITNVSNLYISEYTKMGNVLTLTVVYDGGKEYNFSRESARIILNSSSNGVNIKSQRYRINQEMPGTVTTYDDETTVYVGENSTSYLSDYGFYILGDNGANYSKDIEGYTVLTADGTNELEPMKSVDVSTDELIDMPDGTYIINGRGWGHNVGMSQYGALEMAKQGFTAEEIVTFYYTDTKVEKMK